VILRSGVLLTLALIALTTTPASAVSGAKNKEAEKAGAILFHDRGCAYCHGVGGTGGKKGPDLSGLPKDKTWPPEKITNQILNGGQKMPPFRESVTDDEAAQLVAYLRAKNRPAPPPPSAAGSPAPPPGE
jgi:mono/diheme cytochrome c family protein